MFNLDRIRLRRIAQTISVMAASVITSSPCYSASGMVTFDSVPVNVQRNNDIDYNLRQTKYFMYVPASYTGRQSFGLVVYISPMPTIDALPQGWSTVLDKYSMIFIAPQDAGNGADYKHRLGLGVLGALGAQQKYKIDTNRIYAAGLSGGARTAGDLGFMQSDVFSGTIQDCGSNFYHAVTHSAGTTWTDTNGNPYGVNGVSADVVARARGRVRFTLITGPNDFRHGNLTDIYYNGFKQEGFNAKFIDVPGMGHQDCSAQTLDQALQFVTTGR